MFSKSEREPINIRVLIGDLFKTCHALNCSGHDVTVIASGSMYATIKTTEDMLKVLVKNEVDWWFD